MDTSPAVVAGLTVSRGLRLLAAAAIAGPILLGALVPPAAAHSSLVAVVPAPGGELRLVFAEALEPRLSGADVVAPDGRLIGPVGALDPTDPRVIVIEVPPGHGDAFIVWRALSAADGHVTAGALTTPGQPATIPGGPATTLHSGGHLSLEVLAKGLAFGALLTVLGLGPLAALVLAPVLGSVPRGLFVTMAAGLVVAAIGGVLLIGVDELELAAAGLDVDPLAYVTGARVGTTLGLRIVLPLVGGLWAGLLVRRDRLPAGARVAFVTALVTLVATALSGHAAAYASAVPALVDIAHLVAAGVWLGGLVGLAGLIGGPAPPTTDALRAMIPRFSGLALVSVALLGLTGLYAAWISTEDWTRISGPYDFGLLVKVVVVAAAFAVGGLNFLDGGRDLPVGGGLARRVTLEAGLAALVLVAAASLTTLEPTAPTKPVALAPNGADGPVTFALAPGRAGPVLLVVGGPVPVGAQLRMTPIGDGSVVDVRSTVSLTLESLEGVAGTAAEGARLGPGAHLGATAVLAPGRWDASVALSEDTAPVADFVFALDASGVTEGRRTPPVPPPLVIGVGLVVLAVVAALGALRGAAVPLIDPAVGRISLAGFAVVGGFAGLAILLVGPRL